MSFEGYEQVLCENGHLIHFDVMETFCNDSIQDRVCSICGEKYVWFNVVDTTNGSFEINPDTGKEERIDGYIELDVKESHKCTCEKCGNNHFSSEITYIIPKKGIGHHLK